MNNAEFYKTAHELKAAHDAFRKAAGNLRDLKWVRRAVEDVYFYATKSADTALQLKVGSLVKVMTDLSGEGRYPHYAVVEEIPLSNVGNECVRCDYVVLRFANGSSYSFRVKDRIGTPESDESRMQNGDIKACDIPADLVKIVLGNCPLKNEGACMKAAGHE